MEERDETSSNAGTKSFMSPETWECNYRIAESKTISIELLDQIFFDFVF